MDSSGRKPAAPHHHSPAMIIDIIFCFISICSVSILIMSFLDPLYPALPTWDTIYYYLNHSIYASSILGILCKALIYRRRSRSCGMNGCKMMKLDMVIDLQLHGENSPGDGAVIDQLPWKGGSKTSPGYEWLRVELRKIAPNNGRALLIFRNECGCPVSKLVGWGPSRRRRHNRNLALTGGRGNR